jgi:hypothetical protein
MWRNCTVHALCLLAPYTHAWIESIRGASKTGRTPCTAASSWVTLCHYGALVHSPFCVVIAMSGSVPSFLTSRPVKSPFLPAQSAFIKASTHHRDPPTILSPHPSALQGGDCIIWPSGQRQFNCRRECVRVRNIREKQRNVLLLANSLCLCDLHSS